MKYILISCILLQGCGVLSGIPPTKRENGSILLPEQIAGYWAKSTCTGREEFSKELKFVILEEDVQPGCCAELRTEDTYRRVSSIPSVICIEDI